MTNTKCLNDRSITLSGAIINNIEDACIIALPFPLVLSLRLPRRIHIITMCLFGLGSFALICGIFRTYFLYKAMYQTFDLSWETYPLYAVCTIELHIGIVSYRHFFVTYRV